MQLRDGSGNLIGVAGNPLVTTDEGGETFIGCYCFEGLCSLAVGAQTNGSGGFFWGFNLTSSTKIIRIERIGIQTSMGASVAAGFPTSPRVAVSRFSFTGTPSGTLVPQTGAASTTGKFDTNYPAAAFEWRSAITGATITGADYLNAVWSAQAPPVSVVGTVTVSQIVMAPFDTEFQPRESEYETVIRPGEGIVVWQPEAGSTGDTRKATVRILWEEVTVP